MQAGVDGEYSLVVLMLHHNFVKKFSGLTVGLTGFDGGKLKEIADHTIHVPTVKGEYGPVEDIHMIFDHIIGTYLMYKCRSEN